ncbi:uncharacterized protein M421DRAFT_304599 [Didymella exigua CBS 183.55]|uniref:Uncharacterized protein n=1 Tax=Didymella exigua CBS 183.55 TaxID=1150837 RepID=A0A6A5R802_9PLEO|nr:uncharacterized protein M421DRAFT_304599 [Didymella exigua CBS 183.55]KAF1923743.1 hypothetical protein M421DRAFT_304599 [Didymella exigua CBS 183.55]
MRFYRHVSLLTCVSIDMCLYRHASLSTCVSIDMRLYRHASLSTCVSIDMRLYRHVSLSTCISIDMRLYAINQNHLFPSISSAVFTSINRARHRIVTACWITLYRLSLFPRFGNVARGKPRQGEVWCLYSSRCASLIAVRWRYSVQSLDQCAVSRSACSLYISVQSLHQRAVSRSACSL